jgi:hypothetical protein
MRLFLLLFAAILQANEITNFIDKEVHKAEDYIKRDINDTKRLISHKLSKKTDPSSKDGNFTLTLDSSRDAKPSSVTFPDLAMLQQFENLEYNLADDESVKELDVSEIFNFIKLHKTKTIEYSKIKVNLFARGGSKTGLGGEDTEFAPSNVADRSYPFYRAGISATYPLYDAQLDKQIHNDKLDYNLKLLQKIEDYAQSVERKRILDKKLEYLRLNERRYKAMQHAGVAYLNDRLKVIDQLFTISEQIRILKVKISSYKMQLLQSVKPAYQKQLERLL